MSRKKSPKILVIGGSGFVGSELIKILEPRNCLNFDKKESPFFKDITQILDIRNQKDIYIPEGIEHVVLLAAEHRDDVSPKSLYYDVNVNGTKNVLDAMDKFNVKNLVFTSSVAVYGLNKDNPDEFYPVDPFNHYGKSKWQAEQVINEWFNKDPENKSVSILRPTVIFGERNRGNVYNLLKQISSGKFLMVGEGLNKKSMAYVGNVVAFIKERILEEKLGLEIYNYIDKPDLNMRELVGQVEKSLNKNIPSIRIPYLVGILLGYGFDLISFITRQKLSVSSVRVKKFCATTKFDATKTHKVFKAPFTLSHGLDRTLKYEFLNKSKDDVVFFSE